MMTTQNRWKLDGYANRVIKNGIEKISQSMNKF